MADYRVTFTKRFVSDIKGLKNNKPVRDIMEISLSSVIDDPGSALPMKGNMQGIRKWKFRHRSTEYRILYRLYRCCGSPDTNPHCATVTSDLVPPDCRGLIDFLHVQSREDCNNLYGQKKKYFDDTLLDDLDLME